MSVDQIKTKQGHRMKASPGFLWTRLVWREAGTRYHSSKIVGRDIYGCANVVVWDDIPLGGRTELSVLPCETTTAQRYRDDILVRHYTLRT